MTIPASRFLAASTSTLISVAVLSVLIWFLAGPTYFGDLLLGALGHILGISIVAGVARLLFSRGGWALTITCGVSIAVAGFFIILYFAVSRI